ARSCLDHLACQLASRPSRNTAFPIYTDLAGFTCYAPKQMKSMKPSAKALLQDLQPFSPSGAKSLRWLHDLDIRDKHRLLLLTTTLVVGGAFTGEGLPSQARIQDFRQHPVHRGAVFMTVKTAFDPGVHINYLPIVEVAFAEGPLRHR